MSGTTGEPLSALPVLAYAATAELYAVDPAQPPGLRSGRINVTALVNAATAAALAAAPPAAAGLPAPAAGNTVTTLTPTALLPIVDAGATEYITPADLVTALGNRATDPSVAVAPAVAAGDRLFVDQGGSGAVAVTMATLLAYMQANLAAIYPTIAVTQPASPLAGAPYTLAGTLAHYPAAPSLSVSVDGGPASAPPAGSIVTKAAFQFPMPPLAGGTHSIVVADSRGTLSPALSLAVALPPEALTVAAPSGSVAAGSDFTLSGTYANATPTALDVSLDGGATWATARALVTGGGAFSFALNVAAANSAQVVTVRDRDNHAASASTGAFVVGAAVPPSITVTAPAGWTAGASETLAGTYAGPAPSGVNVAFDSGAYAAAASFAASGGTWQATVTAPAAGSHTVTVQEANATSVIAVSAQFSVGAAIAPVAQVQFAIGAGSDSRGAPTTVTLPAAPTPGNTLLLMLTYGDPGQGSNPAEPAPAVPGFTLLPGGLARGYGSDTAAYTRVAQAGDSATVTAPASNGFDHFAALVELSGATSAEGFGATAAGGAVGLTAKGNATPNVLRYLFGFTGVGSVTAMTCAAPGASTLALASLTYGSAGLLALPAALAGTAQMSNTPNPGYIGYYDVVQANVYGA